MKKIQFLFISVIAIVILQSCMVSHRPNLDFFKTYNHNKKTEYVSINLPIWMAKPHIHREIMLRGGKEKDVALFMNKIKKIKVLVVENGDKQMKTDFNSYLKKDNYQDWMTIKHEGSNVDIKAKQEGENIKKLLLVVNDKQDVIYIDVKGKFTPEDIALFANEINAK